MAVEAIDQEPLVPDYRNSFLTIGSRLRNIVQAAAVDDPATPVRYALLAENDAAESSTHVAMARHLRAAGDTAGAVALLEAVTTVEPCCGSAWSLRADIARSQGREEEASSWELEAIASDNALAAAVHTHRGV